MALFGRSKRLERRGTPIDALVVGLGNPGTKYDGTRHNVGFDTINELARRLGVTLKSARDRAVVAEARMGDKRIVLAMPTTFMNESGNAVGPLARRFGIDEATRIIVVHDELDLEPGVVRVKAGGGLLATTDCNRSPSICARKISSVCVSASANHPRRSSVASTCWPN